MAPHTDDGEFGCGGTIARMIESGVEVYYAAFSACEQSVLPQFPSDILITEVKVATKVLGIPPENLFLFKYNVRTFNYHRQEILDVDNNRDDVIMWSSDKYYTDLKALDNGIVICSKIIEEDINVNVTYLISASPRKSFQEVLRFFVKEQVFEIHKSADIHPSVSLSKNISIGYNVVIENDCSLGENVIIGANTVIKEGTIIADNVDIGSNNVIGGVGFGYEKDSEGSYVFMPHLGNVILKENVEIGNCTCIDRAVLGSTILHENVKVDNLVHIAHGVEIGKNSLIIANAFLAGSVTIGENVWVAPSSTIKNKVHVGDDALIGMGAVVLKDVCNNDIIIGNPGKQLKRRLE